MNVEIGTEAAQFPEKEYINRIFFAVWTIIELSVSGLHGVKCVWSPRCLVKNGVKFIFGLHGLKCVWCDVCIEGVKCVWSTRYEVCCQHGMKRV
jgi:hypothetical protein